MNLPDIRPDNPNFSSGPCSKRPNWTINNLEGALLGRSHRTPKCKDKLKEAEKYFENSKCKICGVVVQPHFQGNTKLPKEEHLAKMHQDLE